MQAQTHAVGDETIDVIVRAYERVNDERPIRDLRWTIMHLFHPSDAALKKMAAIGIMATMQDHPVLLGHNQRRWEQDVVEEQQVQNQTASGGSRSMIAGSLAV